MKEKKDIRRPEPEAKDLPPHEVLRYAQDDGNIKESGGPKGQEPTRFGDWEINGKCVDF